MAGWSTQTSGGADGNDEWAELHRELLLRVRSAGLERRTPLVYLWRAGFVTFLYGLGFFTLLCAPAWPERLVVLAVVAFASVQAGMVSHDITHRNLTAHPVWVSALGQYFMTVATGQAYTHWEWQHLTHHRHTQEAFDDPDMEVSMFALSARDAQRKRGLWRWTTRRQHLILWPLVTLQAFSIRAQTVVFLVKRWRHTAADRWCFLLHLVLWLGVPTIWLGPWGALANYALFSWLMGPYLASSFLWNHVGAFVVYPGERVPYFVQRVLGARSLHGKPLLTFLFGALNFHAEHHLAPHVPSEHLPRVREILVGLLKEHDLPYREWSWWQAMREVYEHLKRTARHAAAAP